MSGIDIINPRIMPIKIILAPVNPYLIIYDTQMKKLTPIAQDTTGFIFFPMLESIMNLNI